MVLDIYKMESVILIVSEEDGSTTHYRLSSRYISTLKYINGHTFTFQLNGIFCNDKSIYVSPDIDKFLSKFRHGRYTRDWNDIAERIKILESGEYQVCMPDTYEISLNH